MRWSEITQSLDEIENMGSISLDISRYGRDLSSVNPVWTDPSDPTLDIRVSKGNIQDYYQAYKDNKCVGLLTVTPFKQGVFQIQVISVDPGFRNRGIMRLLLTYFRSKVGPICSDFAQSPEAKEMWKALIKSPKNFNIMVWNTETDEKVSAKGVPDDEIWNDQTETLLLIEEINWGPRKNLLVEVEDLPHHKMWLLENPWPTYP